MGCIIHRAQSPRLMQPGEAARREHGKHDYFEPKWVQTKMKMKMQMKMMMSMKIMMMTLQTVSIPKPRPLLHPKTLHQKRALRAKPLFLYPVHAQGPICVQLVAWPYLVRLQDEMRHFSRGLGRRRALLSRRAS